MSGGYNGSAVPRVTDGHNWEHVHTGAGAWDEHGASSNQYRVPRSIFENGTPTVVEGLTRDVLGHDLGVPTYAVETFEQAGQYYDRNADLSVPVGKQFAEDAGEPLAKGKQPGFVSYPPQ
jgi:hypothetical protein